MSQALYRKWRPQGWEEVIGQEHVVQTLRNAVRSNRVVQAYLFAGPRGTGKTTVARLLAKSMNCQAPEPGDRPCNQCGPCRAVNEGHYLDLIEIDAASNTSVEDVRDLRDKINFAPSLGPYRVYIIDEVHMLSTAAFNALLKTLEEPPAHALFILATTEIHKIPATVLSRCQRHEFRRIPLAEIVQQLQGMAEQEHVQIAPEALTLIARQATGSLRDAISLLDQLSSSGKMVTLAMAQDILGTATSQAVVALVQAYLDQKPAEGLTQIHLALDAGADPRQFARQVVDYLRNLLLIKMGNPDQVEATDDLKKQMQAHAERFASADLLEAIRAFNAAAVENRSGWQPGLPLELAFTASLEKPSPVNASVAQASVSTPDPASTPRPTGTQPHRQAQAAPPAASPSSATRTPTPERSPARATPPLNENPPAARSAPPPRTEPVATQAEAQGAGEGKVSLQAINRQWHQIVAIVRQNRHFTTQGLLSTCHPLGLKDGALVLGFKTDMVRSKMQMGEHLAVTRQAIAQVLGVDLPVQCVVEGGEAGSALPADVDIDSEGMVGTALRDLGGEIVDIQ